MPLELVCHACDVILQADTEEELVDLGVQHALSIHGHAPPREHVLARLRPQPVSSKHKAHRGGRRRSERRFARWSAFVAAAAVTVVAVGARVALSAEGAGDRPRATTEIERISVVPTGAPVATPDPTSSRTRSEAVGSGSEKAAPTPMSIPDTASGRFDAAPGSSAVAGLGELVTYSVEVEDGLPLDASVVARAVDRVLADKRGWTAVESGALQRVDADPSIHIRLASPKTTDQLCAPLDTGGRLSCRNGDVVVLNAWRWVNGADAYARNLAAYRGYMVNHEFGHALGNGHESCPVPGALAPVMVQQTKGLDGCVPNPWRQRTSESRSVLG